MGVNILFTSYIYIKNYVKQKIILHWKVNQNVSDQATYMKIDFLILKTNIYT